MRLSRTTVRRLTVHELSLIDGGLPKITAVGCWPKSNAWPDGCP
jgi:hypothetical protein